MLRDNLYENAKLLKNSDSEHVKCNNHKNERFQISSLNKEILCGIDPTRYYVIITVATICLVLAVLVILFYKYNNEVKVWLYAPKLMCIRFFEGRARRAFVSFSWIDEAHVSEIVEKLESCDNPYKLCIHYRYWIVGEYIPNQIITSVQQSRRTIIILTQSYVESVWSRLEFRTASVAALKEKRARLILYFVKNWRILVSWMKNCKPI